MVCFWKTNTFVEVIYVDEEEECDENWCCAESCQNFFDGNHMIFYELNFLLTVSLMP